MKVKKYPQSHLLITGSSTTIIIDPGYHTFDKGFKPEEFHKLDAYLITHQHEDHLDSRNIKAVVGDSPVYGNADVVAKLKGLNVKATAVKDRVKFQVGEFEIEPVDLPHCKMVDGSDGPPNTGFLINLSTPSTPLRTSPLGAGGVLFHPGDGDEDPGVRVDNFALPIAGPSINLDGALQFAKDVNAKVVIPIHYDSKFPGDPQEFKRMAERIGIEVRILAHGEETTI